jgi:hypothetical protein
MLVSFLLLLACFLALGRVLRGALTGVQARAIAAGRPLAPFAMTLRPVPTPAGEEVWFASGASLWRPAGDGPGGRLLRLGRWRAVQVGAAGTPRGWRVGGRRRATGGVLVVTNRRVLFRGGRGSNAAREDVPLADVAHLRLEGPMLVIERRSRPSAPLPVRVATAGAVARLLLAAAQAGVPAAVPQRTGAAAPPGRSAGSSR